MNIEKRRAEIAARKAEIRKLLTDDKNADIDALEKELRELNEEDAGLEKRQAIERMLNSGSATGNPIENPVAARSLPVEDTEKLYRSAWLKTLQGKSLTDDEKRVYEQRAYSTAANSALPIIPETTANQIIKKMYEVAPILQRCKIFHVPAISNSPSKVRTVTRRSTRRTQALPPLPTA
jgi:HK97 family phage major capsid protein